MTKPTPAPAPSRRQSTAPDPGVSETAPRLATVVNPVSGEVIEYLTPSRTDRPEIVRALWYGDPGVGKTTAMLTLANTGKVVMWDAEQRLKRSALRRAGVNVDNIELITEVSYEKMSATLDTLRDRAEEDPDFVGICFDGATEMVRVMIQHLVDQGVATAAKKGYERSSWRTYVEDYGDVAEQFRRLMRKAMRLPIHFGMTTLSMRGEDENRRVRVSPQLTPAVARDVNSAMDVISFLRIEEIGDSWLRSGLFIPGGQYDAKDTFGVLPRRMASPTFERILQYVDGKIDREHDPEQDRAAEMIAAAADKQ